MSQQRTRAEEFEERIRELETRLDEKDDEIQELRQEIQVLRSQLNEWAGVTQENQERLERGDDPHEVMRGVIPIQTRVNEYKAGLDLDPVIERAVVVWRNFVDYKTAFNGDKWVLHSSDIMTIILQNKGEDLDYPQVHRVMRKLSRLGEEYVTYYDPKASPSKKQHMVVIEKEDLLELQERGEGR